ncbi:1230_t:CDS:2, partial [Cetraspora pellucida]
MHEQGKKHKENQEKFLRDIYRKEHENRKEAAKTKRELERIEKAAMKQYRRDLALETPGATLPIRPPTGSTPVKNLGYHNMAYVGPAIKTPGATLPIQPPMDSTP